VENTLYVIENLKESRETHTKTKKQNKVSGHLSALICSQRTAAATTTFGNKQKQIILFVLPSSNDDITTLHDQ